MTPIDSYLRRLVRQNMFVVPVFVLLEIIAFLEARYTHRPFAASSTIIFVLLTRPVTALWPSVLDEISDPANWVDDERVEAASQRLAKRLGVPPPTIHVLRKDFGSDPSHIARDGKIALNRSLVECASPAMLDFVIARQIVQRDRLVGKRRLLGLAYYTCATGGVLFLAAIAMKHLPKWVIFTGIGLTIVGLVLCSMVAGRESDLDVCAAKLTGDPASAIELLMAMHRPRWYSDRFARRIQALQALSSNPTQTLDVYI